MRRQIGADGVERRGAASVEVLGRRAACFTDRRSSPLVTHQLTEMLAQRIYGLALGYEDLNDHEQLRHDPVSGNYSPGQLSPATPHKNRPL